MDEVKYFNIGCNDEEWINSIITKFNALNKTDFHLVEMLHWEVIFAKVGTTESLQTIFDFAKFVAHFESIEYIEGRI
ncbi:MAG: hypothetical protein O9262_06290 [Cyclobacteriaceae bacterium]|nr:hypothetical protein [Cyclobacteriaceae bacterium]